MRASGAKKNVLRQMAFEPRSIKLGIVGTPVPIKRRAFAASPRSLRQASTAGLNFSLSGDGPQG